MVLEELNHFGALSNDAMKWTPKDLYLRGFSGSHPKLGHLKDNPFRGAGYG
jgi:hypothetical protein